MIELQGAGVVVPTADGTTTILQPTTLALTEHRISIIGANGSGKSTLARLCNGLVEPSSGSVRVSAAEHEGGGRGSALTSGTAAAAPQLDTVRDGAAVRRLVGFVFTDPSAQLIMPTAIEDVALSLRRAHPRKPERLAAALEVLRRFGLEHLAERSVYTLSGGQKQLLAFASVLATEPAILVADEPTTLLDLRNARLIGELLMSLPQQVIVVTHDLELAARADRTIVVDDARVVFDGSPGEAVEFYRRLAAGEAGGGHQPPPTPGPSQVAQAEPGAEPNSRSGPRP